MGLELLVIRRAENEYDPWSGHMALPGGGYEPGDCSVYDTARRETLEEISIDLDESQFLGRLDDVGPRRMPGQLVVSTVVVAIDDIGLGFNPHLRSDQSPATAAVAAMVLPSPFRPTPDPAVPGVLPVPECEQPSANNSDAQANEVFFIAGPRN